MWDPNAQVPRSRRAKRIATVLKVKRSPAACVCLHAVVGPHHGIEQGQQSAHAGDEDHLLGLPGCQQALVEVLQHRVMADGVPGSPMYSTARTWARPPHTARLPRRVPLSQFNGATPTSAPICLRLKADPVPAPRPTGAAPPPDRHPAHCAAGPRSRARRDSPAIVRSRS